MPQQPFQEGAIGFNMGYILAATAIAGLFVSYLVHMLLKSTKSRPMMPHYAEQEPLVEDYIESDEEQRDERVDDTIVKKKIGVKKAAKLEMKAEKKAAREAMLLEREERKREQEYLDQMRKEEEEKQRLEDEAREEEERLAREELAKKEHEAYLEMAATFEVEEEGYDPEQDVDTDAKLAQFIDYVKDQKVVLLEQLAAHFKMRTKDVVDRIQTLVANGSLIGIIDDRGKFISINQNELESVAKFIRQRGRVTVDELVVNSNKLINLKPEVSAT